MKKVHGLSQEKSQQKIRSVLNRERQLRNTEMAALTLTCNLATYSVISGVSSCQKIQGLWKVLG